MRYLTLARQHSPSWLIILVLVTLFIVPCSADHAADEAQDMPPLISNVFADTYITEVLKDIAYQAQVNIIPDYSVQGFVTLDLEDVPLEEAIRLVLYPGGYLFKKVGNNYLVGSADPQSPLFHLLASSESIKLNYLKADEARRLVSDFYSRYVRFESATHTVFITAPPDIIERFKRDIALIDVPPVQLEIEVMVTELNSEARESLGLSLGVVSGGNRGSLPPFSLDYGGSTEGLFDVSVNQAASLLRAKVLALASSGKVQVKASPRLTVVEGNPAEIFIGKDRYYRLVVNTAISSSARFETIGVGVGLEITPRVSADGNVTLQVKPKVSDVAGMVSGESLPIITRRQAATTVRVQDGETLALGGLIQQMEQKGGTKVPILSDLPIFRNLFSTKYSNSEETEVIIFLTPRIKR